MSFTSHDDLRNIQQAMYAALNEIEAMRDEFAKARSIREYDGDRRKAALSRAVVGLSAVKSVQLAEHQARCSKSYEIDMDALRTQYVTAEKIISRYYFLQSKLDALRSLLSTEKELLKEV